MLSKIAAAFSPANSGAPAPRLRLVGERRCSKTELLEGLWQETLNVAIRSAAAASLLNERHDRSSGLRPDDARTLLTVAPSEPPITSAIVSGLVDPPIAPRTIDALEQMRCIVALGRATASQLLADDTREPRPTPALVRTWRDGCGHALALLYDLELAAPLAHPALRFEAGPELLAALRSARRGGTPCLDENSQPFIPAWAQKRSDMRRDVRIDAVLEAPGGSCPVVIRDVSPGGLGISHAPPVPAGAAVTVVVEGERLSAHVVWSANGQAGLKLDARLVPGHELLRRPHAMPSQGFGRRGGRMTRGK